MVTIFRFSLLIIIEARINNFYKKNKLKYFKKVLLIGNGITHVRGLYKVQAGKMVERVKGICNLALKKRKLEGFYILQIPIQIINNKNFKLLLGLTVGLHPVEKNRKDNFNATLDNSVYIYCK